MDRPPMSSMTDVDALRYAMSRYASDNPFANALVDFCFSDLARLRELDEVLAAKRRLAHMGWFGLLNTGPHDAGAEVAPDLAIISAEQGGLLANLDLRKLSYQRDFRANLKQLHALSPSTSDNPQVLPTLPKAFRSVKGCAEYLYLWHQQTGTTCPDCESVHFTLLEKRGIQQCGRCHRQVSLRLGTVFECSKVRLPLWFRAIQVTLWAGEISASQLAEYLGGIRLDTARQLKNRITDANSSPQRMRLLAGLAEHFAAATALNALPTSLPNAPKSPPPERDLTSD